MEPLIPQLFFLSDGHPGDEHKVLIERLNLARICVQPVDVSQLYATLLSGPIAPNTVVLGLLAAQHEQNCAAARYIRTQYPHIGLLALDDSGSEHASMSLIESGVDNVCTTSASADMVVVILFALIRRYRFCAAAMPAAPTPGQWVLRDQAWVLISPAGKSLALTTAERAFLLVLAHTSGLRATHAALTAAVFAHTAKDRPANVAAARLGVIVSRLRRSVLEQVDVDLPIKSVHRWGYMFSGQLFVER